MWTLFCEGLITYWIPFTLLAMLIYLLIFAKRDRMEACAKVAIAMLAGIGAFFLAISSGLINITFGI